MGLMAGRAFHSTALTQVVGAAPDFGFAVSSPLTVFANQSAVVLDVRARYAMHKKSWLPEGFPPKGAPVGQNAIATAHFLDIDFLFAYEKDLPGSFRLLPA